MQPASIEVYVAAFRARCDVMRRAGQDKVESPGIHGLLPSDDHPFARLLVTDDRAYDLLRALLPDARSGMIRVIAPAARCAELVGARLGWKSDVVTAMICRDLRTVPATTLPSELTLRPVRRLAGDRPDGVPLEDAVSAALVADPAIDDPPDAFAEFLRSLPPATRLFAAVQSNGAVRATSGSDAFGTDANVIFVNTDPGWRGRGIGRAMTTAALRAAQESGARRACLDSSDAGLPIYLRLGFESVARTTRFFRGS